MRIATWNLNNKVGITPFRPEAALAACALNADVLIFTEYFPKGHHNRFLDDLSAKGWIHNSISNETGARANKVLIASRLVLAHVAVDLPDFDAQFPANILAVKIPDADIRILGLRVPAYQHKDVPKLLKAWEWIEATAVMLRDSPAVIAGDLNVTLTSPAGKGGNHFRRIMQNGWKRATPTGGSSYFSFKGSRSEIDHALCTTACEFQESEYITRAGSYELAGSPSAISDHAALVVNIATHTAPFQTAQRAS